MKLAALLVLAVLAGSASVPVASALHMCSDAPMLPGAASGVYDMWNNIWRYWTCSHPEGEILDAITGRGLKVESLP